MISSISVGDAFVAKAKDENGNYKVLIDIVKTEDIVQEKVSLPFTDNSYELKGRKSIFTRKRHEYGYVRIIRNKEYANNFPGNKEVPE